MTPIDSLLSRAESLLTRLEALLPPAQSSSLGDGIAWRWRKRNGQGWLAPITRFSSISLADLQHIEVPRTELERNTRQFLQGLPANNALLWGPRGTGKSSLVKALLNAYADQGLRLIEVERQDLIDLPEIVEHVAEAPGRFIVFCDDLAFDEHDQTYRALKTVLDGSVLGAPDNLLIYATSNPVSYTHLRAHET